MRRLVRGLDAILRRANGVYEFTADSACLLRLARARAPYPLPLPTGTVQKGEPVLALHLWNEHIPPLPASGADLAWGKAVSRGFVASLRAVGEEMARDPRLAQARAVGGTVAFLSPHDRPAQVRLLRRLGFTVISYHPPLGRLGELAENAYAWLLMWTYNAASVHGRSPFRLQRLGVWMSADAFRQRYGSQSSGQTMPDLSAYTNTRSLI